MPATLYARMSVTHVQCKGFVATDCYVSVLCVGQYSGKSEPLPEYHVKIAGFDEKVCSVCTSVHITTNQMCL